MEPARELPGVLRLGPSAPYPMDRTSGSCLRLIPLAGFGRPRRARSSLIPFGLFRIRAGIYSATDSASSSSAQSVAVRAPRCSWGTEDQLPAQFAGPPLRGFQDLRSASLAS